MSVQLKGFAGGDRTDITLPLPQQRLLEAVVKLGKPTVVVLLNGSAVAVNWANEHVPAILEAWYPGQAGGTAIAEALFGDYCPGGRLPVTFYRSVDDLPPFENYNMAGRTYRWFEGKPLYPFGYGLSYTSFSYESIEMDKREGTEDDTLHVRVALRNTGPLDGDEVIQLYVQAPTTPTRGPFKSLKGFQRVHIQKGTSAVVTIPLALRDLRIYDDVSGEYAVSRGTYILHVGSSSTDIRHSTMFKVVK
jgi:beta-glucosidase